MLAKVKVQADRMLGFEIELLRGRIALGQGRVAEARSSLSKAESTHLGEEPRYYLGECLVVEKREPEAIQHFEEICRKYRKGGRAWRRAEKPWFKRAKQRVKELRQPKAS